MTPAIDIHKLINNSLDTFPFRCKKPGLANEITDIITQFINKKRLFARAYPGNNKQHYPTLSPYRIDFERENQQIIYIQIIAQNIILGKGGFKTAHPSYSIRLDLKNNTSMGKRSVLTRTAGMHLSYPVFMGQMVENKVYDQNESPFHWPKLKAPVSDSNGRTVLEIERAYYPYTLGQYIDLKGSKTSVSAMLDLFIKIGETLQMWHSKGYLHNDLKPENIFLKNDGNIHLGDCDHSSIIYAVPKKKRAFFEFWSPAFQYGYATPESDTFAAVSTFMLILFGNSFAPYLKTPMLLFQEKQQKQLFDNARGVKNTPLTIVRQEMLSLYLETVEKSVTLLDFLRKNPDHAEKLNQYGGEIQEEVEKRSFTAARLCSRLQSILQRALRSSQGRQKQTA